MTTLFVSKRLNDGFDEEVTVEQEELTLSIEKIILNYIQNKYLPQALQIEYPYFTPKERKGILENIIKKIDKNILLYELEQNEDLPDYVDVEGFINFRTQNFKKYLLDLLDEEVEDYVYKKEYEEFLQMLKFFISIQEPKCDILNVVCHENYYELYDENLEEIQKGLVESIADNCGEELSKDDILMSNVLTIAPEKIVLHNLNQMNNKDLLKTINSLFEDHISYCKGCDLCQKKLPEEK